MAYTEFKQFEADYNAAVQSEFSRRMMRFMGEKNVAAQTAWDLYTHSRNPSLGFHLFGRHVKDEQRWKADGGIDLFSKQPGATGNVQHPTDNTRSMSAMEYNFGIVNDSSDGSILMMGGNNWNLHVNDAWLLGGVHAYRPFYSASRITSENIFRGATASSLLSITGREFVGLLLAGYTVEKNQELGMVFTCKNKGKADQLDLATYEHIIAQLDETKSRASVIQMAQDAGVTLH